MAKPQEKLAESLEILKKLQDQNVVGIKTSDLSRVHRERLAKNGFIKKVLEGWYIPKRPEEKKGESTSWYMAYWAFCARYLEDRFGKDYCLSAEHSLLYHIGDYTVPKQLVVKSPAGNNLKTELIYHTSLFALNSPLPNIAEIEKKEGLQVLTLPASIVHCSTSLFKQRPNDVKAALFMIRDASDLLTILLEGGHSIIAGRLAGAYRNIGQDRIAEDILETMKAAGYKVQETDPFEAPTTIELNRRERSPYVNRIRLMWHDMRSVVIQIFPQAPGIPSDKKHFLEQIEELYTTDAYHSLSIERYTVSANLIERVRSGAWDIDGNEEDRKQRDVMAARGYWQAFKTVKQSINKILDGQNPGNVVDEDHGSWYRELFAPSVNVGLLHPADLAGYRNGQVYIADSMHTPMNKAAVRDVMPVFFELLEEEVHAGVRAVLGHFIFVYTHPYMDGNGRMARFLMNAMLCSGGYPWTVIPVEERDRYMNTLEQASVNHDIGPFTEFIAWLVEAGLKGRPIAKSI